MEKQITVFIADDDAKIRAQSKERWENRGVIAHCYESGSALLKALADAEVLPNAILMDFVMEDGGEHLLRQLRIKFPELPVIVYSGMDAQGSIRAYTKGAYAVMQRPLDYNELHDTLKELAGQEEMYKRLAIDAKNITQFDTCLVWQFDKTLKAYRIVGWTADIDREFVLSTQMKEDEFPRIKKMKSGEVLFISNVANSAFYAKPEEAKHRKWVSLLAIPMLRAGRLIGWIDCYKHTEHHFRDRKQYKRHTFFLSQYGTQAMQALHSSTLTQHLRIVHETSQNLAGTLDNKLIYETILSKIKEVTGADCGWIYEFDNGEKILKLGKCFGFDEDCADRIRYLEKGGITGRVAQTGISLNVADIGKDSYGYKPEMYIAIPRDLPIKSELAVPLRRRERTLGVLTVKSVHRDFFTQDDSQLVTSLAAIAAVSMERAKLTIHLGEISRRAQEESDFVALAEYVVNAVRDLTDADVNLWMMSKKENEGDDWVRIVCSSKRAKDTEYEQYVRDAKAPVTYGDSLIAEALHYKKHVIIGDLFKHDHKPPFFNKDKIEKFNWHSFMVVPLIGKKGEHLGALTLFSTAINKFNDDDGRLIQHFANQAALALQEQRHIAILQELTEVGQDLTIGLPGAKSLSTKVAALVRGITDADFSALYPYDVDNAEFFDKTSIVYDGNLRTPAKDLPDKPRKDGMAVFIRAHTAIIVEDIDENHVEIRIGLNKPVHLPVTDERHALLSGFIRGSRFIKRENIRSFIGISLQAVEKVHSTDQKQNQEVAVLYVNYRSPHRFSEQEIQVLDIFCNQVANIMHRNRLFESLTKQSKVLEGLHNSALHILASEDEKKRLENIVIEAVKLLSGKGGKVYLVVNGSRQDLKLVAARGLPAKRMKVGNIIPNDKGMAGEVVRTKSPLIVDNYAEYKHCIPELSDFFSAVIEVPLMIGDDVIGVLGVFDDKHKRKFNDKDKDILIRLAGQAALAIYNSRLYAELDALYQTSTQIATQADMKDMAERVLKELKRIIQYDRATFQLIKNVHEPRVLLASEGVNQLLHRDLLRPVTKDDLIATVLEKGRPSILSDTNLEPKWDRKILETSKVRSWVCIPLLFRGNLLGLIMLDNYMPGFYHEKDIPKLERFAALAAVTLYNATLGQQHLVKLQNFSFRILKLQSDDNKDTILLEALNIIRDVFAPLKYTIHYLDEKYLSINHLKQNKEFSNIRFQNLSLGEGLAGWVAQAGEAKLYPDDFTTLQFSVDVMPDGIALLFAPLWKGGEVAGVLEIETKETEHDQIRKSFLSTLITQANLAIQQIDQRDRRLEAIGNRFNPYIVGSPIRRPEDFYGRSRIMEDILSGISKNNYAVVDDRRIGKTSLLYRLEYELKYNKQVPRYDFFPVYLSLQGISDASFYPLMINKIRHALSLNIVYLRLPQNYEYFEFRNDLDKLKDEITPENLKKEPLVVLLIDEIDAFKRYSPQIQEQLRSILVEEKMLRVIMAGYDIDFKHKSITSPWYNFLKIKKLGQFNEEEARNLIITPVNGYYVYQSEAVDLILQKSNLMPREIQMFCFESVSNMFERLKNMPAGDRPEIIPEDVPSILKNE